MGEIRLNKLTKKFNIGLNTLVDFLKEKGVEVESNPNAKISEEYVAAIEKKFGDDLKLKQEAANVNIKMKQIIENNSKRKVEEIEPEKEIIIKNVSLSDTHKNEAKQSHETDVEVSKKQVQEVEQPKVEPKIEDKKEEVIAKESPVQNVPAQEPKVETPKAQEHKPVANTKKQEQKPIQQSLPKTTEPKQEAQSHKEDHPQEKEPKAEQKNVVNENKQVATPKPAENKDNKFAQHKDKVEKPKNDEKNRLKVEHKIQKSIAKVELEEESNVPGLTIVGKVDLSQFDTKKSKNKKRDRINKGSQKVDLSKIDSDGDSKKSKDKKHKDHKEHNKDRKENKNIQNPKNNNYNKDRNDKKGKNNRNDKFKQALTPAQEEELQKEIQKQVKETYAKMNDNKKSNFGAKYRKEKRELANLKMQEEMEKEAAEKKVLKVTEFVTVNDLAILMNNTPVNKVIGACLSLGLMVSINQRLDAETLVLVAEEFGYKVEFVTAELTQDIIQESEVDKEEDLVTRPPIVTVMGHVDHGKTSLLDYIRNANVIAGEAGGITQHIGAYNVKLENGRRITFLDTPGHEAFTAMRARGAQLTDLAIIIIAADDAVMPQTIEAINHAQAANVPMVFAINKIDKPGAQPEKIYQQLAQMNILTEAWGGKYQCQEISAKQGLNVDKLLDKVLLETDMMDLKANPNKMGVGAIIESSLDKGRGYVATVLVQDGTVRKGDMMLCGSYFGRVKAMLNERGAIVDEAGPSTPVSILGLNGAPSAGEKFNIMADEKEAKAIANKREQLIRIQGIKTQKHMTLEEIGRRIAIGNFKELNVIVKGDVDGSVEALSDSLIKLSTEEIGVNVIHKAVGAISESDVMLATASDAVIIGFQVRPSAEARNLAEKEGIEIRIYSIIYDAINDVKDGIEGMLEPEKKEEVTATAYVKQTFKISKIGTIAGCLIKEGKMTKSAKVRLIRDGIVIYTGELSSLKRGKDDAKEVSAGMECGIGIANYNDIKDGDIIEAFTIVEIKRSL